ncbi:MAG: hypothetical protein IJR10_04425 [Clostridia bacterium]|nr:hypothetical protein [Clostridia bacterium]
MNNVSKKTEILFYALNIVLPIIIGTLIYVCVKRDSYIATVILKVFDLPNLNEAIIPHFFRSFLKCFAADMLWAYSLTFTIYFVSGCKTGTTLTVCLIFETVLELLQKTNVIKGTFDFFDIAFEALSIALALLIIKKFKEEKYEKVF